MKFSVFLSIVAVMFVAGTAPDARADRRIFGHVYPYMTLPKGGFEIEHYLDINLNGWDDPETEDVEEREWTEVYW